jgi:hypothetical protein
MMLPKISYWGGFGGAAARFLRLFAPSRRKRETDFLQVNAGLCQCRGRAK